MVDQNEVLTPRRLRDQQWKNGNHFITRGPNGWQRGWTEDDALFKCLRYLNFKPGTYETFGVLNSEHSYVFYTGAVYGLLEDEPGSIFELNEEASEAVRDAIASFEDSISLIQAGDETEILHDMLFSYLR